MLALHSSSAFRSPTRNISPSSGPRIPAVSGILALVIALLAPAVSGSRAVPDPFPPVQVRVDPRVELMSIVFRLAGAAEYNHPNSASPYSQSADAHFGKFRDHAVVIRAKQLRQQRRIGYDAVMSLAVHLAMDDNHVPSLRTAMDPRPPQLDRRWTNRDAVEFVDLLAGFARDANFGTFIRQHRAFNCDAAKALGAVVNCRPIVPWFDAFFGTRPDTTHLVVAGLLNGDGNYGMSYRAADGTAAEILPIIGISRWNDAGLPAVGDEALGTIVHEFCHPYTNAVVDRFADKLDAAGKQLLAAHKLAMQRQAYGSGRTILYESLVRACVVRYIADQVGAGAARRQAQSETRRGFLWVPALAELLEEYEPNDKDGQSFDDFMPQVVKFFEEVAAKTPNPAGNAITH